MVKEQINTELRQEIIQRRGAVMDRARLENLRRVLTGSRERVK